MSLLLHNYSVTSDLAGWIIPLAAIFLGGAFLYHAGNSDKESASEEGTISLAVAVGCLIFGLSTGAEHWFHTGKGFVVSEPEPYNQQLSIGTAYTLLYSHRDGKSYVLLVQEGAHDFYTVRVNHTPPKHFAIVSGSVVAIAPQARR
ncbi:MAG: hypothetical protein B7X04_00850 [Parcubacteria group bacterium 21-54-25]|nr:MAG: hypothetical protein B7X04_00850 [Parcubacteria group bacterium 21-54-25]HQU07779.1 hypothetical protein [Candidatus Paceibacterota bacterium]